MILRTLTFFALTLLLFAGRAGAAPTIATAPAKSTLLRDDPLLQQKITLEVTDRPLGDVLKDLSLTLKADLTSSSQIADQRVTLHLTDQPLYLLMNRLPALLSHIPDHPHGYYWEKRDRSAKERPTFKKNAQRSTCGATCARSRTRNASWTTRAARPASCFETCGTLPH